MNSNQKSEIGNRQLIYLDYNATAPMRPEVKEVMVNLLGEPLNASSIHTSGRRARKLIDEARRAILQLVNGEELIFCGGATEANNLALSQAQALDFSRQASGVFVSAVEHDSVFKFPIVKVINVKRNGIIDLNDLEKNLTSNVCRLTSIMLANNETGIIQPIKQIAELVHHHNGLLHCDAVQANGKILIDFNDLGVDMMTISSHKVGGPVGCAALVYKRGLQIKPNLIGGGQEKNLRAGTENIAAITGFGKISEVLQLESENVPRGTLPVYGIQQSMEAQIKQLGGLVIGEAEQRLPNTSCIIMPGVAAATQVMHFDLNNILVSSGAACSSGKVEVSRVLQNMGVQNASQAIRISTGWATTAEELEKFVRVWADLYQRSGAKSQAAV